MNTKKLINTWFEEEKQAKIHGWDFSHIKDRFDEEGDLPWDYKKAVEKHLDCSMNLLDMDTGGGEFLLSLNHPYNKTSATENYAPNVELCREKLTPLGINFKQADCRKRLPFVNNTFDIIINRHGAFNANEIQRVLKPNGFFITQQVGAENDRDIIELLLENLPERPFPNAYLKNQKENFSNLGFNIIEAKEAFRPIRFYDVGALVWFAHIIEWEFPNFSVKGCLDNLLKAQKILEHKGVIEGTIHRYFMIAEKQ